MEPTCWYACSAAERSAITFLAAYAAQAGTPATAADTTVKLAEGMRPITRARCLPAQQQAGSRRHEPHVPSPPLPSQQLTETVRTNSLSGASKLAAREADDEVQSLDTASARSPSWPKPSATTPCKNRVKVEVYWQVHPGCRCSSLHQR